MTRDNGAGSTKQMPDVASNSMVDHIHTTLDWVGMSEIHLPARVSDYPGWRAPGEHLYPRPM